MSTPRLCIAFIVTTLAFSGCSCGSDEEEHTLGAESRPEEFRGYRTHTDLRQLVHLADVDHHGLFIDFGTPAQAKYTVGDWRPPQESVSRSGWGTRVSDGDTTAAFVGRRGRVYFHSEQGQALTVRMRLRPHGTRALTPWINNNQIQSVRFRDHSDFQDYDFTLPAEHVLRGENHLLLTFGGTERIGDEDVAVAMESIRIVPGESIPDGHFDAPRYGELAATVRVGDEERPALAVRRPTTLSWFTQVPAQGHLSFGVGLEGTGEAAVAVRITPEGGAASEVFTHRANQEWHNAIVDLNAHAGKIVRIELVSSDTGPGRVAWSSPQIIAPPADDADEEREPAKNVVVLLIDTLRASKLRAWNRDSRVQTPVLDRLASEGTVFELAQSTENWTKPSCASVLTGLYPATHGAKTSEARLPGDALLLSEHLKTQGFSTGSFIANGYVSDRFGFDQGWDHYTNYIREGKNTEAENVFGEAAAWIEANRDQRFFAYIQTIDPHVPYDPPDQYVRMYDDRAYDGQVAPRMTPDLLEQAKRNPPQVTFSARDRQRLEALHDGEITQHDVHLGNFVRRMEELGLWENTLLVVTSDHGEEFNDHGSWGHGHSIYQELLHVPLMFRLPGNVPAGRRVADVVGTLSIPASVTDLLGVEAMPNLEGPSLVAQMYGHPTSGPQIAFSDFLDDRRVAVTGRWKFILRGNLTATMFDLQADPAENQQLGLTEHPIAERYCRVMLGQYLGATDRSRWLDAEQGRSSALRAEDAQMDDEIRDQLRALGYAN